MTKVAITGSSGYLGTTLCEDLKDEFEIVPIDIKGVAAPVDISDLAALEKAFAGCETVIHLARFGAGANVSWADTQKNLNSTYNVYEAARLAKCKRVIIASSNHAMGYYEIDLAPKLYEPKSGIMIGVNDPPRASGLYGIWKVFGEVLGRYYSDEYGLQVACLRIAMAEFNMPVERIGSWMNLTLEQKQGRLNAMFTSPHDIAGLCRAIMHSDVPYGIVYAVGDNATRFYDLEEARRLYGFWPKEGRK